MPTSTGARNTGESELVDNRFVAAAPAPVPMDYAIRPRSVRKGIPPIIFSETREHEFGVNAAPRCQPERRKYLR